jgi:hypothetical protein
LKHNGRSRAYRSKRRASSDTLPEVRILNRHRTTLGIIFAAIIPAAAVFPASAAGADPAQTAVTSSAVLIAPNSNAYAGVLLQHCAGTSATMRIILPGPRLLQQTEYLAVQVQSIQKPAIRVDANNEAPEVAGFEGHSTAGCLPTGTHVVLVSSPGGPLGGLLVVVGAGTTSKP